MDSAATGIPSCRVGYDKYTSKPHLTTNCAGVDQLLVLGMVIPLMTGILLLGYMGVSKK